MIMRIVPTTNIREAVLRSLIPSMKVVWAKIIYLILFITKLTYKHVILG